MKRNELAAKIACASALVACACIAHAQDAATTGPSAGLEEIIVTAQKREESLQAVPIAITALNSEMLDDFRVTNIQDLNGLAPNLQMVDQGSLSIPIITIRGISSGTSANTVDPKAGLYLDGVYIGRSMGSVFDLAEIERVEVLRGPQGTLFGRNATAGAISIVTFAPTGEFGLKQDLSTGSNDAFRARTSLNLPAWGPLSVRLSYLHDEDSGSADNLIAGNRIDLRQRDLSMGVQKYEHDLGSKDTNAFMAAVRLDLADSVTVDYKFDYTDSKTVGNPAQQLGIIGASAPLMNLVESFQAGYNGITNLSTERLSNVAAASSVQALEIMGHNLTLSWDVSDTVNFKSITAWREMEQDPFIYDLAATGGWKFSAAQMTGLATGDYAAVFNPANAPGPNDSFFNLLSARSTSQRQFSQELQLTITHEHYDLTGGVFYFTEHSPQLEVLGIFQPVSNGVVIPDAVIDQLGGSGVNESITDNDSIAIFAQGTWHATDKLDLTAGIRRTEDDRQTEIVQAVGDTAGSIYNTEYGKTNYTLIASYAFSEEIMAYAKVATGYVAGGVMTSIPYDPEEVESYEVGVKSQFLNNRLRVNAAAFFMDYTDMQIATFIDGVSNFQNAGKAEASGLELEVEAVPLDGLSLSGTLGYTDFDYKQYLSDGVDMADQFSNPYTPDWNARLSAQYDFTSPGFGGTPYVRLDAVWRDEAALNVKPITDPVLADISVSKAHWLLNARAGILDVPMRGTTLSVSLWAKNLLDEDDVIDFGPEVIDLTAQFINKRTVGADFSINL